MIDTDRTVAVAFGDDAAEIEVDVYHGSLTKQERNTISTMHNGEVLFVDEADQEFEWVEHGSFVPWHLDQGMAEASFRDDETLRTFSVRHESATTLLSDFATLERDVWYDVSATFENGDLQRFELSRADVDRGDRE